MIIMQSGDKRKAERERRAEIAKRLSCCIRDRSSLMIGPSYRLDVTPARHGGYTVIQRTTRKGEWDRRWWHWPERAARLVLEYPHMLKMVQAGNIETGRLLKKGKQND